MTLQHAGLAVSIATTSVILVKIWAVAHGDPQGMAALVSAGGLASIVGALVAGVPAIGMACILAMGVFLPEAIREGDRLRGPLVGTFAAILLGFATAPWHWFLLGSAFLVGTTALSFLMIAARRRWERTKARQPPFVLRKSEFQQDLHPLAALGLLATLGLIATACSDTPWLPSEDISTSEEGTITGYVLDQTSGFVVLKDSDRSVVYLHGDDVKTRSVCATSDRSTRSALGTIAWRDGPEYRSCEGQ
jgi:hypothetical protein